jgi:putative hydrolase of the HAD superfamily
LRYETVFLDVGHTLIWPYPSYEGLSLRAYQRAGVDVDPVRFKEAVDDVWAEVFANDPTATYEATEEANRQFLWGVESKIFDRLGVQKGRAEIFEHLRALFNDPASYRLFPDVHPTLAALKARGLQLAIVSNWNWHLPDLLQSLGLADPFEFIVVSARVGCAKPHPGIFQAALVRARAHPEQVIHVGDSYHADLLGAQNVGLTGVLLDREGEVQVEEHLKIKSLDELLMILDGKV